MARKVQSKIAVVFDRRKKVPTTGAGLTEVRILTDEGKYLYASHAKMTAAEWKSFQKEESYALLINCYEKAVNLLQLTGKPITLPSLALAIETINKPNEIESFILQQKPEQTTSPKVETLQPIIVRHNNELEIPEPPKEGSTFINFYFEEMNAEKGVKPNTKKHRVTVYRSLVEYGKLKNFEDITVEGIEAYDAWLHEPYIDKRRDLDKNGKRIKRKKVKMSLRTDSAVYNYHKSLRPFIKIAAKKKLIPINPYTLCSFKKGTAKERRPLVESELIKVREAQLTGHLEKARDIFIFCAYTGLSYADAMDFCFTTMTDHVEDMYYIDGRRTKSQSQFYTPILQPAMDVLKKYNMILPYISNQKLNDYLHVIEAKLEIHKSMTSHVARHSFGTLNVTKETNLFKIQKMMGHKHITTTEIYIHLSSTLVTELAPSLNASLR